VSSEPHEFREPGDPEAAARHRLLLSHHGEPAEVIARFASDPHPDLFEVSPEPRAGPAARLGDEDDWLRRAQGRYWIPDTNARLSRLQGYAPRLLFLAGHLGLDEPTVAVVGTRHPDEYGVEVARSLGRALARAGVTVVSGGALGVDRVVHEAVLDAAGRTIVVFGGGLAVPHPKQNRDLFERVVAAGSAIVSEYPVFSRPAPRRFPERNRLIAALSDAVVVVQAGAKSGALITAEWARRVGVPVFAVPADLWYHASAGSLELLRTGARPLTHPSDLGTVPRLSALAFEDWPRPGHRPWGASNPWADSPTESEPLEPADSVLVGFLRRQAMDLDALAEAAGRPVGRVQAELVRLEVSGVVQRLPGGKYRLVQDQAGSEESE